MQMGDRVLDVYKRQDEDEKAMVGKLALVNEAKKYLAEENGREATVQELAAYTQLTEAVSYTHLYCTMKRATLIESFVHIRQRK